MERVVTLALLARVGAGTGNRALYGEAWWDAWTVAQRGGNDETLATALLDLARASALLRDGPRLEQACELALAGVAYRGEPRLVAEFETLARGVRPVHAR
jgi:hypothetical protein